MVRPHATDRPPAPRGSAIVLCPGEVLGGRFVVERFVRAGGMGAVYRARDEETGAPVALKVLLGPSLPSDDLRFAREAATIAELDHPGIVRHVAHGDAGGRGAYLAMEWIEGEDLATRLARERLAVDETLALGLRLSTALGAAHAGGVVHRDLKPSNVLIAGGDMREAKIVDFGLAAFREASRATLSGAMMGTPAYMAPERARGEGALDPRVDVFALGCILHECLSGKAAFEGEHMMAVLARIVFEEVPRLRDLGCTVPSPLDALIASMLSKSPRGRPADGDAVASAIAAIAGQPARSTRPSGRLAIGGITGAEQRVVCILLARGPAHAPDPTEARSPDETVVSSRGPSPRGPLAIVEARGGRPVILADGTLLATTEDRGLAVDQATLAAGWAIALGAARPGWAVSIATGRTEVGEARPVGDAIDRAARRLSARIDDAAAQAIDLDDVTAGLLDLRFEVTVGPLGLELSGERDVAEAARTLLGRRTSFVGRDREMATLEALFAEAPDGPAAQVVLVTGAAGVGKSRLRHELLGRLGARGGVEIWMARGDPMHAGAPFGVLAQLLRRIARLVAGEPPEAGRQKLLARVSRHVAAPERLRVAEFLGEIAGEPFPDEGRVELRAARQDPRLRGDQMRRAWIDLVEAEVRARPLVLVLDDLHWGDAPSVDAIDAALRILDDRPLSVLALARPEVHERLPRLFHDRSLHETRLGGLPRRACERLIRDALGEGTAPGTVAEIWERSLGNALFLEELLRASSEGRDGARLGTAMAMLGSRLDALPAEDRRLLRAASVFGEVFWSGGVAAVLSADPDLARLEAAEWIVRRPSAKFRGETEHAFRHALVREAAYGMLTEEDRALGHRLAGAWLAAAGETDALVMAEHFERGGEAEGAVHWHVIAVEQALEGDDLPAVLARVDRAAALGASGEALGRLSLARATAHHWRGEQAEAERWAAAAVDALPRDGPRWCAAMEAMIWALGARGDGAGLALLCEDMLASPPLSDAIVPHIVALSRAASWLVMCGDNRRAQAIARALDPLLARCQGEPAAQAAAAVARVYLARPDDDPSAGRALLAVAIARLEEAGDRRQASLQRANLAALCNVLGAFAEAEAHARRAEADARRLGVAFTVRAAQSNLGPALARRGSPAEAVTVLRAALGDTGAEDDRLTTGVTCVYLAEALLGAGDREAAEREARSGLRRLAAFPPYRIMAEAQLADVLLAARRTDEALAHARAAFQALSRIGDLDEGDALVRVVYAEALDASGAHVAAAAARAAAQRRLLLRAARFEDEADRRRFLEEVPDHARTMAPLVDPRRSGSTLRAPPAP